MEDGWPFINQAGGFNLGTMRSEMQLTHLIILYYKINLGPMI
jgi:hypothetical protein